MVNTATGVRFSICPVHDFPLNPACSFISHLSTMLFILLSINRSSSLYVWHKRKIGWKFFASVGCLSSFINAITWLFPHIIGILTCCMQLYISNSHLLVCFAMFFICSVLISSRPGILFSFIRIIVALSSSKENSICDVSASLLFLHLLGHLPGFFAFSMLLSYFESCLFRLLVIFIFLVVLLIVLPSKILQ